MVVQVLLTCKHKLFSEGVASILKCESDILLVGTIGELNEINQTCQSLRPDVLVVAARAENLDEMQLLDDIVSQNPDLHTVAILSQPHREAMQKLFAAGVTGFVSSFSSMADLTAAIRFAAQGRSYVCQLGAQNLLNAWPKDAAPTASSSQHLGVREEQVLSLIAEGHSTKEIARQLDISPHTVDVHRRNIMRKVGLHKVADLTRYAIRNMLVPA